MTKTQPLIAVPPPEIQGAPITVAFGDTVTKVDALPVSLCWGLVGVSAIILLIQIWSYFA